MSKTLAISQSEWEWFGHAGHFVGGHDCRFHLCTRIGDYLVSTLGEWVSKSAEEWRELSHGRTYETMVFAAGPPCDVEDCKCGQPTLKNATELDMLPANNAGDARDNHMTLCEQYAAMEPEAETNV